ncbi:MAG: hypothetical protein IKO25_09580 [Clostridia bacterium]|nr:hypothetical protein [Clostridia bacterium]
MKKLIALAMVVAMLFTALGVLAEEGQMAPLYATVGEALEDSAVDRIVAGGVPGEYYAVVTQKDGKYYRSVAICDEKLNELNEAIDNLDYEAEDFFEKHEAAMQAADDYLKTLPIAYSEEFTAQPLTDEEIASKQGKSLSQLTEEGFEIGGNSTEPGEDEEEILIVYSLRYGVYDYRCVVDADFDQYNAAQDNGAEGDLVVKSMSLAGITERGFEKRFHTDGTVEKPEDPSAEFSEIMAEMLPFFEKIQAGEEIDIQDFADALKAKYPDYANMIDMYVTLYQTYGIEGLSSMMNSAE